MLKTFEQYKNNKVSENKIFFSDSRHDFTVTKDMVLNGSFIKDQIPNKVIRHFYCRNVNLISLEGSPIEVGGIFNCAYNKITSLKGVPKEIGDSFYCTNNNLTSLEGGPTEVSGSFDCSKNNLTSLKYCQKEINVVFDCSDNNLTSLEYGPIKVNRNYIVDEHLEIERNFIKYGQCSSTEPEFYWLQLLQWMLSNNINLEKVKGWPIDFKNDNENLFKSVKVINKFNI